MLVCAANQRHARLAVAAWTCNVCSAANPACSFARAKAALLLELASAHWAKLLSRHAPDKLQVLALNVYSLSYYLAVAAYHCLGCSCEVVWQVLGIYMSECSS